MKLVQRIMLITLLFCAFSGGAEGADGRLRVGVLKFGSATGLVSDIQAGIITDIFIRELAGSPNIAIYERERLDSIGREQRLGMSGLVDPATAVQVGRIAGLQYILTGNVTQFSQRESRNSVSIPVPIRNPFGSDIKVMNREQDGTVTIDMRIFDVATSEIIFARSASGSAKNSGGSFSFGGIRGADREFDGLQARAIADAVAQLSSAVRNEFSRAYQQPYGQQGAIPQQQQYSQSNSIQQQQAPYGQQNWQQQPQQYSQPNSVPQQPYGQNWQPAQQPAQPNPQINTLPPLPAQQYSQTNAAPQQPYGQQNWQPPQQPAQPNPQINTLPPLPPQQYSQPNPVPQQQPYGQQNWQQPAGQYPQPNTAAQQQQYVQQNAPVQEASRPTQQFQGSPAEVPSLPTPQEVMAREQQQTIRERVNIEPQSQQYAPQQASQQAQYPQQPYAPSRSTSGVDPNRSTDPSLVYTFPIAPDAARSLENQQRGAQNMLAGGRYMEAFTEFRKLAESYNGDYLSAYWAGVAVMQMNRGTAARAWFDRALSINPNYQPALDARARLNVNQ